MGGWVGEETYHARHLENVLVAHPVVVSVGVTGDRRAGGVRLHDPHLLFEFGVGLCCLGGRVSGLVGWEEEEAAVRMRCCALLGGGWVGRSVGWNRKGRWVGG